jgi:putative membrane protein
MTTAWIAAIVSALHVLAIGIGLPSIALRGWFFSRGDATHAEWADNAWGIATLLWIGTGLYRLFGGVEKGAAFYMMHWAFHTKMGLFAAVGILEIWPMYTLMRWRFARSRGEVDPPPHMGHFAKISAVQTLLITAMAFAAAIMARALAFPL